MIETLASLYGFFFSGRVASTYNASFYYGGKCTTANKRHNRDARLDIFEYRTDFPR